jgi:Ni,Fe-hydrogenase III large subunit
MRLVARFANDNIENFEIIDIFEDKTVKTIVAKSNPVIKSITKKYPAAIWFERKIKDDFGIKFEGSFDERELVHHERFPKKVYPMRKNFDGKVEFCKFEPYEYEVIKGDGVFEVGVGPVHAGIIEPGHFQFSQEGENMLHLEVRHFYTYRAIEKMVEGKTPFEAIQIIEKISGIESIAYQVAYLDILSQSSKVELPMGVKKYNALLLELERVIHHINDLGFIPNDAGFAPALAFCSQKSEEVRRILKDITSHRFGFGAIRGNSAGFDKDKFLNFIESIEQDIKWFKDWIDDMPSLWDRFDTTGILRTKNALKYSCIGVVARASGLKTDVRNNEFYKKNGFKMQREKSGDVAARFNLRIDEVFNSCTMIKKFLDFDEEKVEFGDLNDGEYSSFVESSIGELYLYLKIKNGLVDRFFARNPSFINWQAIHLMMSGNIIADFPLINKSCDLSYAGNDL